MLLDITTGSACCLDVHFVFEVSDEVQHTQRNQRSGRFAKAR